MKYYWQLIRPANLVTAVADIAAGVAISGITFASAHSNISSFLLLCTSTIGLYGGGVVFNDIFDAKLDAIERPERALPSGKVPIKNAIILGIFLIIIGLFSAYLVNNICFIIAIVIASLALFYDKVGKHSAIFGPINMGLCRGFNLLLGIAINSSALQNWYLLGLIPVIYIAAITVISRFEVHGGQKNTIILAGILYLIVSFCQLFMAQKLGNLIFALPFIFLHILLIFKPLFTAFNLPSGSNIGKAVKAGVLALIVMDAAWVAISGNILMAVMVLILMPISIIIAKAFAVT